MDIINEVKKILENYKNIVFAFIFGSFAKGTMGDNSDIDIAVYLYNKSINVDEYLKLKTKLEDTLKKEIDIAILNDASPLLKHEVCKEGILVFTRDEEILSNFKVHTIFEHEDFKRYRDYFYNSMIEKIRKEVN